MERQRELLARPRTPCAAVLAVLIITGATSPRTITGALIALVTAGCPPWPLVVSGGCLALPPTFPSPIQFIVAAALAALASLVGDAQARRAERMANAEDPLRALAAEHSLGRSASLQIPLVAVGTQLSDAT